VNNCHVCNYLPHTDRNKNKNKNGMMKKQMDINTPLSQLGEQYGRGI
jgi:hypothetical protein